MLSISAIFHIYEYYLLCAIVKNNRNKKLFDPSPGGGKPVAKEIVTYDMILISCMFQIVHFIKCITLHLDISLIFYYEQTVK